MFKFFDRFKKKKKEEVDLIEEEKVIEEPEQYQMPVEELPDFEPEEVLEQKQIEEVPEQVKEVVDTELEEASESVEKIEDSKPEEAPKVDFFTKLKQGLAKTKKGMVDKIDSILASYGKIDEDLFDELEEILITSDVGVETTMTIIDNLKERVKENKATQANEIREFLKMEIKDVLNKVEDNRGLNIEPSPAIVLVVGVNGVGKTTTIGKLAYNLRRQDKKVLIAAGDTFRAAAIEQLQEWSNRAHVDIIAHSEGSDPAAVIYDGIQAAKARDTDVLICDTAGRLHNKKNLMNELNKIFRVVEREFPEATKEVLLVVDATTGQNAILQAKVFKEVCDITGIVLTKLDGTAKGGVVIALQSELEVPVKLVGVGEGVEDLQVFEVESFIRALIE
ncbi:signal recognition particle-docking protein FtsY [Anaerosalibacter sp. Marseille-P3206]|uniref:signal recognition particle-docking protein FtsY n=1 Tax=Anaerosalibacter sp. Marseille-P3206 TaxID=1871005 RepID=UPI0009857513|nr:signal recognition particle-docking protein FtsY [Anaerosalibacter sp. Marseille-P3206]